MLLVKRYKNITLVSAVLLVITVIFVCSIYNTNTKKNPSIVVQREKNTAALIELGRYLFYDRRLSINNTRACGTCHNPAFAFTDGYKKSIGAYGDILQHNTLPLFNLSNSPYLTLTDSTIHTVYQQMNKPMFNQHPIEMGIKGNEPFILKKLCTDALYTKMFFKVFGVDIISMQQIQLAIGSFILSINSNQSTYDKFIHGDTSVFSSIEKKGLQLFTSTTYACANCHGGINFNTPSIKDEKGNVLYYHNIDTGINKKKEVQLGLYQHTKQAKDIGKYRVSTLRNLVFTAPYFHDGSFATLQAVINNKIKSNSNDPMMQLKVENDKKAILAFLLTLTDSSFTQLLKYQNPFIVDETIPVR